MPASDPTSRVRLGYDSRLMDAPTTTLEFRSELGALPERVFASLTESDPLARWFCDHAASHATPGGRLTLRWSGPDASPEAFEGRWVVFRPPVACAYEGGHAGYPDGYAGRVGFELAALGGDTLLIVRHRLPARADYETIVERYRTAWPRALERLALYLRPTGRDFRV